MYFQPSAHTPIELHLSTTLSNYFSAQFTQTTHFQPPSTVFSNYYMFSPHRTRSTAVFDCQQPLLTVLNTSTHSRALWHSFNHCQPLRSPTTHFNTSSSMVNCFPTLPLSFFTIFNLFEYFWPFRHIFDMFSAIVSHWKALPHVLNHCQLVLRLTIPIFFYHFHPFFNHFWLFLINLDHF